MKVVELCGSGHFPVINIRSKHVEIGEKGNSCTQTKNEWEVLKQKIINREIQTRELGAIGCARAKAASIAE